MGRKTFHPTMFEQPVVGKFEIVRVHFDCKYADTSDMHMQSLNLFLRKRITTLFGMNSGVIQNFI